MLEHKNNTIKAIYNAKNLLEKFIKIATDISADIKRYDDIMNKPLLTPEDRMARLEAIEDSIKDYNTFDKAYKTRHHGRDNHKLGDSSLTWLFDETKGRTVFPTEVGKNKVYESHIQSTFANQVSSITSDITFCLTAKELDDFTKSPMYDQFTDGNSRIFVNAFYDQGQKTKSLSMSFGNPVQLRVVKNPEAYKKLIDDVSKLGEFGEKNILDKIENDDIGLQMKDYIRARIVNPAKRIVKGKGAIYLESKTPLGLGINQMAPQVPTDIENDKLRDNIKKWQHRFPVYSLYVECDKQLNTFADYYTEKEKAGGTLSPEREKYYRQKIY